MVQSESNAITLILASCMVLEYAHQHAQHDCITQFGKDTSTMLQMGNVNHASSLGSMPWVTHDGISMLISRCRRHSYNWRILKPHVTYICCRNDFIPTWLRAITGSIIPIESPLNPHFPKVFPWFSRRRANVSRWDSALVRTRLTSQGWCYFFLPAILSEALIWISIIYIYILHIIGLFRELTGS